jgi:hypothetical protein
MNEFHARFLAAKKKTGKSWAAIALATGLHPQSTIMWVSRPPRWMLLAAKLEQVLDVRLADLLEDEERDED